MSEVVRGDTGQTEEGSINTYLEGQAQEFGEDIFAPNDAFMSCSSPPVYVVWNTIPILALLIFFPKSDFFGTA